MQGDLLMSRRELERKTVFEDVTAGRRTLKWAKPGLGADS